MQKPIIKYGIYALVFAFVAFFAGLYFDLTTNVYVGYATIIASLMFVYFGIKHYRDKVNNGKVSLGKAIAIGMLITLFSAVGVALFDYIYTTQINPDFVSEYLEYSIKKMETTLSPEELKVKSAELIQQMEDYGKPWFMAFMMFASVIILGFIISLISGLILQRK